MAVNLSVNCYNRKHVMESTSQKCYDVSNRVVFENTLLLPQSDGSEPVRYNFIIQQDELRGLNDSRLDSGIKFRYPIRFADIDIIHENMAEGAMKYSAGFMLTLADQARTQLRFHCLSELHSQAWYHQLKKYCFLHDFADHFEIVQCLHDGENCKVQLLYHRNDKKKKFVGKFVAKSQCQKILRRSAWSKMRSPSAQSCRVNFSYPSMKHIPIRPTTSSFMSLWKGEYCLIA